MKPIKTPLDVLIKLWVASDAFLENDSEANRQAFLRAIDQVKRAEIPAQKRSAWLPIVLYAILLVLIVAVFVLLKQRFTPTPAAGQGTATIQLIASPTVAPFVASGVCVAQGTAAAPVFLPDQGFSLFQAVPNAPTTSILSNSIRSLGMDGQGVWVGYWPTTAALDGVSYYDKNANQWLHCPGLPLAIGQAVNGFAFQAGSVYVAVDGGADSSAGPGVARLAAGGWRKYSVRDRLPSTAVYSVSADAAGALWAATLKGVARFADPAWEPVYVAQAGKLPCDSVSQFLKDNQGTTWFALVNCGISSVTAGGVWTSYFTDTEGLQNARALAIDDQGGVWAATDGGGVVRFYSGRSQVYTVPQLPDAHVQDVKKDVFGRIWVATNGGVAFTADYGKTWVVYSTKNTVAIVFGCATCMYDGYHIWLALKDNGVGHGRIPPEQPTVAFTSLPQKVQLHPGDHYIFQVEVQVLAEGLHKSDGDSLRSNEPAGSDMYNAWPVIEMAQDEVAIGQKYTFSNTNNPIIAPPTPGTYRISWRLWQGRRFVTDPITVEFDVVSPARQIQPSQGAF